MTAELATTRFLRGLQRRLGADRAVTTWPPADRSAGLASEVADGYLANVRLVQALAGHYRFDALFYWQPTVFQKRRLTSYEGWQRDTMHHLESFFEATYSAMRRRLGDGGILSVRDLSQIFAALDEPIYIDWAHPGEAGNGIIANDLAHDIIRALDRGR